jgi:integrase
MKRRDLNQLREWAVKTRRQLERVERILAPRSGGETLNAWSKRWLSERAKRHRGAERELGRYTEWVAPKLGKLPVATLSRSDVDGWIEHIESQVTAGQLRATTAWRIWTVLRAMMRDASGGRVRSLRVRDDNPTVGLRLDRGTARASTFLYPSEFARLISCKRVPLALRRQYALAVYLYPRAGELAALEWSDIDIETGRVHVHRSLSRDGEVTATKTETDRQFVAERAALPLLRAMRREAKGRGLVTPLEARSYKGQELRAALRRAGCKRADLHASDTGRRPFTFHDLRATGITWMAMRGDSPTDIMERVGHQHLSTTEIYLRRGRLMAVARGERVFPSLAALLRR